MPSSRRFLLLLVLACVTCVVLVQISMVDVSSPRQPQYSQEDKEPDTFPDVPTSAARQLTTVIKTSSTSPITHNKTIVKPTTPLAISRHASQIYHTSESNNVYPSGKNRVEAKVQVRRLPLSKNQQFVSRNERLKEIIKKGSVQKRPALDPMRSLKSIPVVDPRRVQRIFVVTYFRAGSSFFGDILQQNWKTFYHFEPLHSMTYDKRINDTKIPEVFTLFDNILGCNFTEAANYMQWVQKPQNQFLFAHNLFLWVTCHSNPKTCFDPRFVNEACARAPVHVMKITRLHMRHLRSYIESNPDMNFKVVYLTRDPRGIVSSRWSLDWCKGTNCSDAGVLCHEMDEDLAIFNDLQRKQPSNFVKLRYEDLSLNPEYESQKLFNFLRLPFSPSVKKFLKTHTVSSRKADDKNPYSTRRNSSSMVLSWMERFTFKQVVDVQMQCKDILHKLNHSIITSPNQLPYPNGKAKTVVTVQPDKGRIWRFNRNPIAKKYLSGNKEYVQHIPDYLNTKLKGFIPNNTNIEVHKSYKVVESLNSKGTPEIAHYPIT